ncbi:hypothetical protein [Pseudarthrobacter sp. NamE2]|nr:hypothetical protein [Pseudarthrobacter sp. NamE2]
MTENPLDERVHTEAPAEGDPDADVTEIRVHTQDPAEGPDEPDAAAPKKA